MQMHACNRKLAYWVLKKKPCPRERSWTHLCHILFLRICTSPQFALILGNDMEAQSHRGIENPLNSLNKWIHFAIFFPMGSFQLLILIYTSQSSWICPIHIILLMVSNFSTEFWKYQPIPVYSSSTRMEKILYHEFILHNLSFRICHFKKKILQKKFRT